MTREHLISVIIPTYNSGNYLRVLLNSLKESNYNNFEIIINDDKRTSDNTLEIINHFKKENLFKIKYIKENISRAQARKRAACIAQGEYLLHLDSDMKISKDLLKECTSLDRYDALVIPERSYGSNFWGRCKALEKSFYEGVENLESLRFIKKDVYFKVGGHNVEMVFSEDKDLDLRVKRGGFKVGRTKNYIYHNEGSISLGSLLGKKKFYTKTAYIFSKEHPREFRWQSNIFIRYFIFLKNFKCLFINPGLYTGLFFLKTCEYLFSGFYYILRDKGINDKSADIKYHCNNKIKGKKGRVKFERD